MARPRKDASEKNDVSRERPAVNAGDAADVAPPEMSREEIEAQDEETLNQQASNQPTPTQAELDELRRRQVTGYHNRSLKTEK